MTQDGFEKFFQSHQLLLTNEKVVAEKPELLEPAVQAMLAAEEFINGDPSWPELITGFNRCFLKGPRG